jgi:hypothetical protein
MTDKERPKTLSVRFALPVDTTANAFPDQARSTACAKLVLWPSPILDPALGHPKSHDR